MKYPRFIQMDKSTYKNTDQIMQKRNYLVMCFSVHVCLFIPGAASEQMQQVQMHFDKFCKLSAQKEIWKLVKFWLT